jgi:hypothetical protein
MGLFYQQHASTTVRANRLCLAAGAYAALNRIQQVTGASK